jgi:hypothetical protein
MGREPDQSFHSSVEVKNGWRYISTYVFIVIIKQGDKFAFGAWFK